MLGKNNVHGIFSIEYFDFIFDYMKWNLYLMREIFEYRNHML